jgi:hypothetical protein
MLQRLTRFCYTSISRLEPPHPTHAFFQLTYEPVGRNGRGELNGLVVCGDVRIGLTLYSSSCSTRYELNLLLGKRKKMSAEKKCFAKTPHKGVIRAGNQLVKEDPTASCGCPHAVACPQTAHSRRKGHLKKKGKVGWLFLGKLFFCLSAVSVGATPPFFLLRLQRRPGRSFSD